MSRYYHTHGGLPGTNAGGRNGTTNDITSEVLVELAAASAERKMDFLRILRGKPLPDDTESLRRCPGQVEPFLTLKETARSFGLSACSLWRWRIPGHTLGGRPKFRLSEVEAYLTSDAFRQRAEELREQDRAKRGSQGNKVAKGGMDVPNGGRQP